MLDDRRHKVASVRSAGSQWVVVTALYGYHYRRLSSFRSILSRIRVFEILFFGFPCPRSKTSTILLLVRQECGNYAKMCDVSHPTSGSVGP